MTGHWQLGSWKLALASSFFFCGALALGGGLSLIVPSGDFAYAQITPDTTLGSESSTVTSAEAVDTINGGATRGANLFHSFQEFNVGEGRSAVFTNPAGIENILTRVTGGNPSNIFGTLGVSGGNANLFLINPNGIIFGRNASLNIGGSFVATTASAIGFGNQGFFSAMNPESPSSLLTVNPSALLFNQIKTASIQNNSVAPSGLSPSTKATTGLRVPDGKSLLLVGSDINMDGGGLFAFGGRVELGGLAGAGTVELNGDGNNLSLSFPDSVERSNVSLSNGATVRVTADNGGSIAVNARNLEITGESELSAGIASGLGDDRAQAGIIEVEATGVINLNNKSRITNYVESEARGQGGDVSIGASSLRLEAGAQIGTSTFGAGKGGNLTLNTFDIQLIGIGAVGGFSTALSSATQPNSTGDAGNLTINTHTLLVRDGARVNASTDSAGKGGNLTLNATDIQLIGTTADGRSPSGLGASAQPDSTGDAGNLTIKTDTLLVRDGAQVGAFTSGAGKGGSLSVDATDVQLIGRTADGRFPSGLATSAEAGITGDAGNLRIKTNTLLVQDGAQVFTGTYGVGKGGSLSVDATDVQLIGKSADGRSGSGLFTATVRSSTGDAGDLTINTDTLLVRDGARASVQSFGTGTAGNITLNARSIRLDNNALFTANTRSAQVDPNSEQATINISSQNLFISRNSNIFTNATGENVIGGNINIDTDFIIAFENSDIRADSANFRGGNVRINADGIFGSQFRDLASERTSDITATGASPQLGGTVQLNIPDIKPNSDLDNLPSIPVDIQVARACTTSGSQEQSEFVVTGRGGLPDNPSQSLGNDAIDVDLVTLNPEVENHFSPLVSTNPTSPTPEPIVEAQGWVMDNNGEIVFTASASTNTPINSWQTPANCHTTRNSS